MQRTLFTTILITILFSCESSPTLYCEKLEETLERETVQSSLLTWFDNQFADKLVSKEDFRFGGLYIPGQYTYLKKYDWATIGFDEKKSRVKLLSIYRENISTDGFVKVSKVFLGERSRVGILIKSDEHIPVANGTDGINITEVTDRIAIICGE